MAPRKSSGKVTLAEVAKHARVGVMTASRVLNKSANVSEELRERVLHAAQVLGYVPHSAARALASGRSNTVFLLAGYREVAWAERAVNGLAKPFSERGLRLNYVILDGNRDHDIEQLKECLDRNPSGIILPIPPNNSAFVRMLEQANCPVVTLVETPDNPLQSPGGLSPKRAGYETAQFLIGQGYQKIGFFAPRPDWRVLARLEGFTEALKEANLLRRDLIVASENVTSIATGVELFSKLKAENIQADAIACYDDQMAAGALFAAQRMGISVPQEIGICGFGGYEIAAHCTPSITTLTANFAELNAAVVEHIVAFSRTGEVKPFTANACFTFFERETTARQS